MSHHGALCFKSAYQLILLFALGGDSPARLESPKLGAKVVLLPETAKSWERDGRGIGEAVERPWGGRGAAKIKYMAS